MVMAQAGDMVTTVRFIVIATCGIHGDTIRGITDTEDITVAFMEDGALVIITTPIGDILTTVTVATVTAVTMGDTTAVVTMVRTMQIIQMEESVIKVSVSLNMASEAPHLLLPEERLLQEFRETERERQ